jgi:hypothetical protein
MQKIRFFPPEKQPRSIPAQTLVTVLVPGKRKPLIKETLTPTVPVIDNRHWPSVSLVRKALADNRLHASFAERALADARAYELALRAFESGFQRGKPKGITAGTARAITPALYARFVRAKMR